MRSERRPDLLKRLTQLRLELEKADAVPPPPSEVFAPLDLLEATIKQLELRRDRLDEWADRLAEARLEMRGCAADLDALEIKASELAPQYKLRLESAQSRLAAIERSRRGARIAAAVRSRGTQFASRRFQLSAACTRLLATVCNASRQFASTGFGLLSAARKSQLLVVVPLLALIALNFWSIFDVIGLLVVMAYARRRFDEPSFPNHEALPRTVDPLRYLFLRPDYTRARLAYVAVLVMLYTVLVAAGQSIVPTLDTMFMKDFPPEAWALLIALFIIGAGLAPDSLKWLNKGEELLRQWVHAWFLVPDGIEKTIGVLEDAQYEPPERELSFIQNLRNKKVQEDLKCPPQTLRYRWARATTLVISLKQMRAGAAHPLKEAAFDPFQADFDAILEKYRALKPDVEALDAPNNDAEEQLSRSVDHLLKRVYAYISWGVQYQAESEQDVNETLKELGFRIPTIGGRRLFDIVIPAVLLIALITMVVSWITNAAVGLPAPVRSESIVIALSSAMAASLMYGGAVLIALSQRSAQIERRVWREGSPKCLIPIAIKAGLVSWCVIIATSVLWDFPEAWRSLVEMIQMAVTGGTATGPAAPSWHFLLVRVATAQPWLLAGATASAVLASSLAGDVRLTNRSQRVVDAIVLGGALIVAVGSAQLLQNSLMEKFDHTPRSLGDIVSAVLAGFACGAVIGFKIPWACKANVVTPPDPIMARALRDLLRQAESDLDSKLAAENWVFTPHSDLGGITPAEAVQYQTRATGVHRLLWSEASARREQAAAERPLPVVIEGVEGRSWGGSIARA